MSTTKIKGGNLTGAYLARYALEQLPVKHVFGIPGVHNTELYDEINKSEKIEPILVTHEGGGAFMADGISRTSDEIGTLLIVPAAGTTHAMSGIGEAFLDGIPMLVISGGIRSDIPVSYQLHELDLPRLLSSITKFAKRVERHDQIVPTIFEAYRHAVSGEPGPVFVEIPVNIQLFKGEVAELPVFQELPAQPAPSDADLDRAVDLLLKAKQPGLFLGWGAKGAREAAIQIADLLGAPVSTTLQGLTVFPADHPMHTGMGFGAHSVPAAENAFADVDCMLAVGTRFAEIPTGSFGAKVPENLIHVDINSQVFHRNHRAKVALHGDSAIVLNALLERLKKASVSSTDRYEKKAAQIARDKAAYYKEWEAHRNERVNPYLFFRELKSKADKDMLMVVDDGNHTFLSAELFPVTHPVGFISPTDFNCMGYSVPAAIGAKLASPSRQVVSIVGDGAFLMTGLEIITASSHGLGVTYFVFYDGELSQISQGQEIPYNRKTCTVLGNIRLKGIADATGAAYVELNSNEEIGSKIDEALRIAESGRPVIVDVKIDYSKRTRFTKGVVGTVLKRFPIGDKFRFIGRALWRKLTG
ncbi:MAG: thiamine pyrophosphate-binding protein [Leptonema illini]|uniref:Thiamine pyrophosphate-binding protein n=1 Tax=Leptonema illini TaxID=183 RepID=A0A833H444_9LEPT|nr:MAG: thiamine pyrophosphate-binding protein [Leptonema illini]